MRLFQIVLVGIFVAMAASATTLSASGEVPVPSDAPFVITLQRYHKALWTVRVTVNGRPANLLFDSGGGMTMLSTRFAARSGCRYWGRVSGFDMFGHRIDTPRCDGAEITIGALALHPSMVGRFDAGERLDGDDAPDGMLSLDAFEGRAITLDMGAGRIVVETPHSLAHRIADMREVPMKIGRQCSGHCVDVFVGIPVAPGMAWLTLDSGAGGVSLIASDYAPWFGLAEGDRPQRLRFAIAPGIDVDSPVLVADMAMDGNLGQPFLSRHLVTLDLAHGRMWMAPAKSAASPG